MAIDEQSGQEAEQTAGAVNPEQNAGAENPEQGTGKAPEYVSAGEFGRRFGKLEKDMQTQLQTMMSYIAAQQQAAQQPRQASGQQQTGIPTDEELWSSAQTGDRQAFEEYQRRIARREVQAQQQTTGRQNLVETQLSVLAQKYPVLNDSSHPLTQKAQTAYQLLVNAGYPANRTTLLEAAKTALADSPDLVSELYGQGAATREHARQSGIRSAQSGVTGASYRNDPPRREGQSKPPSEAEQNLARRMGIKDPKGAKERFLKRQQDGLSTIDPRMIPVVERLQEDF